MILDYNNFYRQHGVRRVEQLMRPRFGLLQSFQLPRGSILHSAHGDPTKFGPVENDIAFRGVISAIQTNGGTQYRNIARPVQVEHVTQLSSLVGAPRKANVVAMSLIRQYHLHYRRFRRVSSTAAALQDKNSMIVFNYDLLPHLYRYARTFFNQYFEWYNVEKTMWTNIAKVAEQSDRPQFIVRNLPKVLPARSAFEQAAQMKKPSQRVLSLFNTPEHLFLIELWRWFGPYREASMLSAIPRNKLHCINLVFQESGKWVTVNLGLLDSWRQPDDAERYENEPERVNLIKPPRMQMHALRFFMAIQHLRTEVPDEIAALADQSLDQDDHDALVKEFTMKVTKVEDRAAIQDPVTGIIKVPTVTVIVDDLPKVTEELEDTPDTVRVDVHLDAQIDADIAAMEKITAAKLEVIDVAVDEKDAEVGADPTYDNRFAQIVPADSVKPVTVPEMRRLPLDEAFMAVCNIRANDGQMTAAQLRHFETISKSYKTLKAPDGVSTLEQYITIPTEALVIKESPTITDIPTVTDKTMLKSSLLEFDERYIKEVMSRDVTAMTLSIQNAGVAVTAYNVERVENIMGSYEMHTVRAVPAEGIATTLHFKLPVVEEDGSYMANGTKYRLRKQRNDLPIRKVGPDTVALTSYYGKAFVKRSEKKVNDYGTWLRNSVMALSLTPENPTITACHPGTVADNLFKGPRVYTALAAGFRSFTLNAANLPAGFQGMSFNLSFDHTKRESLYGLEAMKKYEQNGAVIAGAGGVGMDTYFLIGRHGTIGLAHQGRIAEVGRIEDLLGLDRARAPVDFAVMKIAGETIPVGVILGYVMGLDAMISLLQTKIRRVPAGKRLNLEPNETALIFNDESLVIDKNDQLSCMFLAGFNEYHRGLKRYNVHLFNKRDVYFNLLDLAGLNVRYLREIDLFFQMFVDPITRDLLIEMGEPTDVRRLLLRAGSMLLTDDHPDELDAAFQRLRGYERMAGAVYSELVRVIRKHNSKPGKGRATLDMSPYEIWTNIQTDPSKAQVMDINPIQNLKEKEAVTYNGVGGRNSRTMTKHTRSYHVNDMGTISGDTVDSSDVAINTYTSADPQFTSLRGISRRFDLEKMGATPLLSTSALISVGSDHDDPKRVNFIGIQHTHGVSCNGYHQMAVRTGYEQIIAHRTSDMYAVSARDDGVVKSVSPTGVTVQFANGDIKGYEVGIRYGNAAGLTIPHQVVSNNLKVGDTFTKGDILTYNKGFFEKDFLNPKNVTWKAGVLARVALMEVSDTLEDSSAISETLASKLATRITKIVPVTLTFDQVVRRMVKVGDLVNSEDILCIIEDAVTSNAGLFDEESLDTLRILGNQTPQAKAKGVIERIEVFYHGDKEDMSDSLRAIANAADRELAQRLSSTNKKVLTGSVDEGFRIDGDPLQLDSVALRFYISGDVAAGEGDKGVFANQMKTVFGKKFSGDYRTEQGAIIDAIFGQKSIDDRIVNSPAIIGTTNVLLDLFSKEAVAAYNS